MTKLANTIFESGAKDQLITTDVYKASTGIKNSTSSSVNGIIDKASKGLSVNKLSSLSVNNIVAKGSNSINATDMTNRLIATAGGNRHAFDSLTSGLKSAALTELTRSMGLSTTNVKAIVGETETLIDSGNLKTATGITSLINTITGNSKLASLFDVGSEFALIKTVVLAAIAIGIPLIVDAALDHIKDEKKKKELLLSSLRQAAIASDLDTINKAISYVGATGVLARVPEIVTLILTNYRWKTGTEASAYSTLSTNLINTLNAINPNWHLTERNNVTVSYLKPFTTASVNAITLLSMNNTYTIPCMIASKYLSIKLVGNIKAKYPKCRITV